MVDIIVVGGGPAGLTAALYAARAGRGVLVLEQDNPGGQILYSPCVENYPGMPGMSGAQYAAELTDQVERLGVRVEFASAGDVTPAPHGYDVHTDAGVFSCRALVLAPGTRHRTLGLDGEVELTGAGVSYCAVCDGPFYRGKRVAVVGGGDTALQDALFLSGVCERVTLVHRRAQLRGEARLAQLVREKGNVEFLLGFVPEELLSRGGELTGVRLRGVESGEARALDVDGLFIAVGQEPGTAPFAGRVDVDAAGYFLSGEDCRTKLPGVSAAGDCRAKQLRQLATAIADGAVAGMSAARFAESAIR